MKFLASAVSLVIVMLASMLYSHLSGASQFESFVTIALGFIILESVRNESEK